MLPFFLLCDASDCVEYNIFETLAVNCDIPLRDCVLRLVARCIASVWRSWPKRYSWRLTSNYTRCRLTTGRFVKLRDGVNDV